MREQIARALYDLEHPRGIRKWEEALPFIQEELLQKADVAIRVMKTHQTPEK
jgi:hypothetical protein